MDTPETGRTMQRARWWFVPQTGSPSRSMSWRHPYLLAMCGVGLGACMDLTALPEKPEPLPGLGEQATDTGTGTADTDTGENQDTGSSSDSESADTSWSTGTSTSSSTGEGTWDEPSVERKVVVYLDGKPTGGIVVTQGGVDDLHETSADGSVSLTVDTTILGEIMLMASDPRARIGHVLLEPGGPAEVRIDLTSMVDGDNEDYPFYPPGNPESELFCSHCHHTFSAEWYASPHRTSASNPAVQDLYVGVVTAITDDVTCRQANGRWWTGIEPGTGKPMDKCYLGAGALPDLNPDCGDDGPCDGVAERFGSCANCHAPGIDGKLGGRDILEARKWAYADGVHCDVCHQVDRIDLDPAAPPGVGGRLVIKRPMEPSDEPWDEFEVLSFGPRHDVGAVRMGAVYRDHYTTSEFCSGCHQWDAQVEPGWGDIDTQRWPDGRLPVHSTYEEWAESPVNGQATCQTCHMPPNLDVINGADVIDVEQGLLPGRDQGWHRPLGSVRSHSWIGPRQPESEMLQQAAELELTHEVTGGEVVANVTVRNHGAGHAVPTGEPMRNIVLLVEATCDGQPLTATGGASVPEFGGWLDRKEAPEDWTNWPGAKVGELVRVVQRTGDWYDYDGFGPFGDGSFTPEQKGLPVDLVVGESEITAMAGDVPTFEPPLPSGDVAYRVEPLGSLDALSGPARAVAGAPGFGFARVMQAFDGSRDVPHHRAVDVVSDNRLLPKQEWTSEHRFEATCANPRVGAVLVFRPYAFSLARERQWDQGEAVMAQVWSDDD